MFQDALRQYIADHIGFLMVFAAACGSVLMLPLTMHMIATAYLDGIKVGESRRHEKEK